MTAPTHLGRPNLKPLASTMPDMPVHRIPLVQATAENLKGYGEIIEHTDARAVEIVRWPSLGWRQVEPGTGDQGGTTEGPLPSNGMATCCAPATKR